MSRSGYLFNQEQIRDDLDHYGLSVGQVGAGTGLGDNPGGIIKLLGGFRDSTVPWLNVGTETEVTVYVNNSLNEEVTVVIEGFLGDPDTYVDGDLADSGNWTLVDTLVVAAAGTGQSVIDLTDPTDYDKIRVRATATVAPSGGASADEEQTINLGDVATANAIFAGQLLDTPLVPNISDLGDPEFTSQIDGLRGSTIDAYSDSMTPQAAYANDEPFGNPLRPSFRLTYNTHDTVRVYYDLDITAAIQSALEGLVDFAPGDVTVARTSASVYTVDFGGAYAGLSVGTIAITSPWGFTPTGVSVTEVGGDYLTVSWVASRGDSPHSGIPVGT